MLQISRTNHRQVWSGRPPVTALVFVAVASVLQACQDGELSSDDPARSASCGRTGALHLTPTVAATFARTEAPVAMAANTQNIVVVHSGRRTLSLVPLKGGDVRSASVALDSDISAVARLPRGFAVAAKRQLYALDETDLTLKPMTDASQRGAIRTMAATDTALWVASQLGSAWWLTVFRLSKATQQYAKVREMPLHAEVSLQAYGTADVLVTQVRYPYTMRIYDASLRVRRTFSVIDDRSFRTMIRDARATMSLDVMPLDCERVLQPFVNVVSGTRLLVVVDFEADEVLRIREIESPLGFSQAILGAGILLGAVEQAEGRSIVAYRWSWDSVSTTH